jgi:hypothetical protein
MVTGRLTAIPILFHSIFCAASKLDNKITLKVLASGKGAYAVNFSIKGSEE